MINEINELVGSKQFDNAKVLIDKALEETPDNVELLKLAGLTYVNLDMWMEAKKAFETIVKFELEDATSWFYLAKSYENLGDFISAKNAYLRVIELRSEYKDAYTSLCIILMKLDEIDLAIEFSERAKTFDADFIFDFIIGTCYMKLKEFQKAIAPLEIALSKKPENLGTLNSLGTCYMATGNNLLAIQTYEKAIEINPNAPMTYYNIGSAYQILQNHQKAIEYFKKAIDITEDESFLLALAISEVKLGLFNDALKHYTQLALLCPNKENYKYNIAICYEALGNIQTAIKLLEELIYINPKFLLPAQKLASLYIKSNQLTKAKEIYDNILLKGHINADIMHQYAILSSSLCDSDTAEKMLKKVIRMNPEMAKAHKDLGIIYLNKRLFDYAEDEFKTALKLEPNDFEILFEYGNFLYSTSKNLEADRYYNEALEVNPNSAIALTFMALNKLVLNQLDEAYKYISKAISIEPNHEYVQFCMGRILFARNEFEEAKRYLIRAVEQNPDVETQNTLALTYFELGEYEKALNIFQNLETKHPQNISVLMEIAKCYEMLKNIDLALKYFEKVVSIFPDNEMAHEKIRELS
ncbi:tetratricopeptide repeat protein [bacterium]|nr:tetratricopeptide repeat protein [bacterium]